MDPVVPIFSAQFVFGMLAAGGAGMIVSLVLFWIYTSRS